MDQILKGQKNTVCYSDDVLVTRKDEEDHKKALEGVLKCLEDHGIKLKLAKCGFFKKVLNIWGTKLIPQVYTQLQIKSEQW